MSERVPEDWHKFKIGFLISEISEKTKISNQHEVLSVTKDGIQPQIEYFKKQIASEDNSGYKIVRKGHLVFGTMNLWMGSLDVLKKIDIGIVSPAYKIFEFNANHCLINFMSYFMRTPHMISKYVLHSQQGASIVRRNLDLDQLLADEVVLPSLPEQMKIVSILTSVDEVIENTQKQIDKLQDLKKATMKELLTKGIGHTEFKDSELGRIPKSWEFKALNEIVSIPNGQVDPKIEPYASMPHIGSGNIISWTGQIKDVQTAYQSGQISGKYLFNVNHILYSKVRPNLAKVCMPQCDGVCSADIYPLLSKEQISGKFIFQYLLTEQFTKTATAVSERTGMPKINRQDLSVIKLHVPPFKEQLEIAKIIESIDDAMSLKTKKLSQTQFLKKSFMQDLLTGKVRVSVN